MLTTNRYHSFYRTTDSRADYHFEFARLGSGSWRVYVLDAPSYGARSTAATVIHRLSDEAGRPYLCWTAPLRSLEDAMAIAGRWADATQHYIATGERF